MRLPKSDWYQGWDTVTLGECCEIQIGKTPSTKNPKYWGGSHIWLSISDMKDRVIRTSERKVTDKAIDDGEVRLVNQGTLMMSFKLTIGKLAFAGVDLFTNEAIAALIIKDEYIESLLNEYLYWVLQAVPIEKDAIFAVKGKTINKSTMKQIEFPLPRLDEQRRIVARIEALFRELKEMRKINETIKSDITSLRVAVLFDIFNEVDKLPQSKRQEIELRKLIDYKSGFSCNKKYAVSSGVPHLRPHNISTNGEVVMPEETVHIPPDYREDISEYELRPNDVLYNNTNSVELVGKSAIVEEKMDVAFSNHINRLRVKDTDTLLPYWLLLSLRYLFERGYFEAHCNRWVGQAGFGIRALQKVKIIVPLEIDFQRKAVNRIRNIDNQLQVMEEIELDMIDQLDNLEQSILMQAFRGEL